MSNYGVRFPMFSKIEVNGDGASELYRILKAARPGDDGEDIPWNFTKFLVDRQGNVLERYAPQVTPEAIGAELSRHL